MNNNINNKLDLQGVYKMEDNLLIKDGLTLKLGIRHRLKKGQAKRFIGLIDETKPEKDQYMYLSSLYSNQGENSYSLEYQNQNYKLKVVGINSINIIKADKEPILKWEPENLEMELRNAK